MFKMVLLVVSQLLHTTFLVDRLLFPHSASMVSLRSCNHLQLPSELVSEIICSCQAYFSDKIAHWFLDVHFHRLLHSATDSNPPALEIDVQVYFVSFSFSSLPHLVGPSHRSLFLMRLLIPRLQNLVNSKCPYKRSLLIDFDWQSSGVTLFPCLNSLYLWWHRCPKGFLLFLSFQSHMQYEVLYLNQEVCDKWKLCGQSVFSKFSCIISELPSKLDSIHQLRLN